VLSRLFRGAPGALTRTDASGSFRLTGIPFDASSADLAPPDLDVRAPGRVREYPYRPAAPTAVNREFILEATMVLPGSISGKVVDASGAGVGGAEITYGRRQVLAGADGSFLILGLERDAAWTL